MLCWYILICTTNDHHICNHQIKLESTKFVAEISGIVTCPQHLHTGLQHYYVIRPLCSSIIPKNALQFQNMQSFPYLKQVSR